MKRISLSPSSHLLTPILLIGTLLFAVLVTFFSIKAYNREQENVKNYTQAQMKSLVLDLEAKASSLESAMVAASYVSNVAIENTTVLFDQIEQIARGFEFVYMAGLDYWIGYDVPGSTSIYIAETPEGYVHRTQTFFVDDEPPAERECSDRAYVSGKPEWSIPYVDEAFSQEIVLTCFYRVGDKEEMLFADVEMKRLLQVIDSLQFYDDSQMFVSVPGGQAYTMVNGAIIETELPSFDDRHYYTINAHYDRANLDIINVVPNKRIFDSLLNDLSVLLIVFIIGLAFLAFCVHRAFNVSQDRLARTIEESHSEQMARKLLEDEISIAARIQNQMLTDPGAPAHFAPVGCNPVDVIAHIIPAREVGGDLYEYRVRGESLFFCIGDVSGKGVPAAMVMSRCSTLFHAYVRNSHNPGPEKLLSVINEQLCRHNEDLMFVTMWSGELNLRTGELKYASAGHNPPVLASAGQAAFLKMSQGLPLGMFDDSTYPVLTTTLNTGETLLLYTDGITEAEGPGFELFGNQRLLNVCSESSSICPEALCSTLLKAVHSHTESCNQSDDITLLAVAFNGHFAQLRGIGDVSALHVLVDEVGQSFNAAVVLEEAAVNAFSHGGATYVCVEYQDGTFALFHDGDEFDPTAYVAPPATEELQIGGRGILLMRKLCSDINYRRTADGINILTMKM